MPIDKRVQKSSKSVIELRELLREVCQSPKEYINDTDFRKALKSQGALSKYSNNDHTIIGTSINTVIRAANEFLDGGFEALDNLRKTALHRIEDAEQKEKSPTKRTRAGLAQLVTELEGQVQVLEKVNFALIQCISDIATDLRSIAHIENKEAREHRANDALRKLTAMMAINHPPFDKLHTESSANPIRSK